MKLIALKVLDIQEGFILPGEVFTPGFLHERQEGTLQLLPDNKLPKNQGQFYVDSLWAAIKHE